MKHEPIPEELEQVGREIVDSAYRVHKELGPGLLESVYEECMVLDLSRKGLKVERQVSLPIRFDGQLIENRLRLDMLVNDSVVVEKKAVVDMYPLFESQLLTYLRVGRKRLGFLINYNVPLIMPLCKRPKVTMTKNRMAKN